MRESIGGIEREAGGRVTEERRIVSVLFADVAGSTALGEELDPEDLRALLGRFFAIAREAVESHGGTVEKFIGDAVMAVFGLPSAHGDDAERALLAALEIRDRVQSDPRLREPLPIRLGVNTGEVIAARDPREIAAGSAGSASLVTGDAVNVAARLQQVAGSWEILVGQRTARAAAERFAFGPPLDVLARGRTVPVNARPLLGRAEGRHRKLPIVGREADLAQLELVARRAVGERRPYLVTLSAPAGTGKSRILEEFLDRLPSIAPDAAVAVSQCVPYGQVLTYWPLRAVLHRLAGVDEDAPPEVLRRAVAEWLDRAGADQPARLAELLAATIGAGATEIADPNVLADAWRSAVALTTETAPLVLVFEDLHWSSDSLLDLVESLMVPRGDIPLLMIVLTRPELLDRRPNWGGGRRNHLALSIEPLRDEDIATLVRNLLESATPDVVQAVVARADGNPFYAGEIVRSVAERLGGSARGQVDVATLLATLPDTVQATVLARLDQLPADERRALQVGAVFGRAFRTAGIAAVEPSLAVGMDDAVSALIDRDLVRASGADGYVFRHILIREVAYQTLTRSERARLHAAAGGWLEERAAGREETYAELIAFHYREAATLGISVDGEVSAEVRDRAERWLGLAADAAIAAGALIEADRHLRAALELTVPGRAPDLWLRVAETSSDGASSVAAYDTALELAAGQDRSATWQLRAVAGLLTWHMRFLGSVPHNLDAGRLQELRARARALAERTTDERARARFLVAEGFVPFYVRNQPLDIDADLVEAEASARAALAIGLRLDDVSVVSPALDALASLAQELGDWPASRDLAMQRLGYADRLDLREAYDAHNMYVSASALMGDLDEADRHSSQALAALRPGQVPSWGLQLACWRIYGLAIAGDWDGVLAVADRARRLWAEAGRPPAGYATFGLTRAVEVARARRDEQRVADLTGVLRSIHERYPPNPRHRLTREVLAQDLRESVPALLESLPAAPWHPELWLTAASDRGVTRPPDELAALAAYAERLGLWPLAAQARRAQGISGREPDILRGALEVAERLGMRPTEARLHVELGRLEGDAGLVERGRRDLEALGDLLQLERYRLGGAG